jgi:hypothetical protein
MQPTTDERERAGIGGLPVERHQIARIELRMFF